MLQKCRKYACSDLISAEIEKGKIRYGIFFFCFWVFFFYRWQTLIDHMQLIFQTTLDILNETLPHSPPSSTLVADAVCRVGVYEHLSLCVCLCVCACLCPSRAFFRSLLNTWMGAVSEMEVLMISLLKKNESALPGECRFYDSDLHRSEVTSTHTHSWARNVCFLGVSKIQWGEFWLQFGLVGKWACIFSWSVYFCSFCLSEMAWKTCSILVHFLFIPHCECWECMSQHGGYLCFSHGKLLSDCGFFFCFFRSNNHFSFSCFFFFG